MSDNRKQIKKVTGMKCKGRERDIGGRVQLKRCGGEEGGGQNRKGR